MTSIVFTKSRDVFSGIVRWATRSRVSHVGIGFEIDGVQVIAHAYGVGGVQISRRSRFLSGRKLVAEFVVEERVSLKNVVETLGDRYDYESVFFFVPVIALRWFGRKLRKPWVSSDAAVCSELVCRLHTTAFFGLDPETVTPQDLLVRCQTRLPRA